MSLESPHRFTRRWGVFVLAFVCAVLIGGRYWLPSPWTRAEAYLIDAYQRMFLVATPETRVVVVDLDEASLAEMGAWPWPRARLARLVQALFDDYDAGVVGLDLVLPEPADAEGDSALARLAAQRRLVLAQVFDLAGRSPRLAVGRVSAAGAGPQRDPADNHPWPAALGYIGNHAGLAGTHCAGHLNYLAESDGQVRRLPPFIHWQGRDHPAFAFAMLQCAGLLGADAADSLRRPAAPSPSRPSSEQSLTPLLSLPISDAGGWRVPWTRQVSAFTVIPAAEVVGGRAPHALLRGAFVLVGSSSLGLSDLVGTPVSAALPGVMVHAQALGWLLDHFGEPAPPAWTIWLPWAWLAGSLLLLGWLMARRSAVLALAVLAGLTAGWIYLAHLVFGAAWAERAMPPLLAYGVLFLVGAPVEWAFHQRQSRRLSVAFRDYLPPQLIDRLMRQDAGRALAVTRRQLTLLFADIEDSTAMAERLPPEALAEFTRGVLECMTRAIHASGGTLDKYLGDGVLAFWGAPLSVPDHADLALEAAEGIRRELAALNAGRIARGDAPVMVRVGINTGEVVVGDLGTRFRRSYTVMGEAVNLAHRLQVLARERREFALAGAGTAAQARRARLEPFGEVRLRGLSQPQQVFRLLGDG